VGGYQGTLEYLVRHGEEELGQRQRLDPQVREAEKRLQVGLLSLGEAEFSG